jgi:hypothetical protein
MANVCLVLELGASRAKESHSAAVVRPLVANHICKAPSLIALLIP